MSTLYIDNSADSFAALAVLKYAGQSVTVSQGELKFESGDATTAGSDVLKSLLEKYPNQLELHGQDETEKESLKKWTDSPITDLAALNQHLQPLVYVADTVEPTYEDFKLFASLREEIKNADIAKRNEFVNVTRWFSNLQNILDEQSVSINIDLTYTPPPKKENKAQQKQAAKAEPQKPRGRGGREPAPVAATGIGRLLLQVGKIVEIEVHPTTPSMYVEKVDVGESAPRTVVSKLAEKIPIEQLKDRLVVVATNLQPADLQGVVSAGLIFCASIGEDVEPLTPPEGSTVGEVVTIEGTVSNPDKEINKKIFLRAIKGLATNGDTVACHNDVPLKTTKGNITVASLKNATIK